MNIHSTINEKHLTRTINDVTNPHKIILACAILIAYEHKYFTKILFNLRTENGSLHLEYKPNQLTYYYRNFFSYHEACALSVSVLSDNSSAYTSHVISDSSSSVFNEFLRVSEQRDSILLIDKTKVSRIDTLPTTKSTQQSHPLPSDLIEILEIE